MRRSRARTTTPLTGTLTMPGDKSVSHRALILGALARGRSRVAGINTGLDVRATARAVTALGAGCAWDDANAEVQVEGYGWEGLREPDDVIDAGNSGTTLRTLLGVCAGVPGLFVLTGDATLRRRPMLRVVAPLRQMGAAIDGRAHGDRPPVVVRGGPLEGVDIDVAVASAQVKTAVLLAGLRAAGTTTVRQPGVSRDHTERMLAAVGAPIRRTAGALSVDGGATLTPLDVTIPGDISAAMFFVVAATLVPGSDLTISGVGLNPTRTGALDVLKDMGARIDVVETEERAGEPVGDIRVHSSDLVATTIEPERVPTLIDEIPVLALAASQATGETAIRGAAELRVKESDRLATVAAGLRAVGADIDELPDGLVIRGPAPLGTGRVDCVGDHRIAMTFAIAGVVAGAKVTVDGWSAVATSFPEFVDLLGEARPGARRRR